MAVKATNTHNEQSLCFVWITYLVSNEKVNVLDFVSSFVSCKVKSLSHTSGIALHFCLWLLIIDSY